MNTTINCMNEVRVLSNRGYSKVGKILKQEASKYGKRGNFFHKNELCNIVLNALSNLGNDETVHLEQILKELPDFFNMSILKDTLVELAYRGQIIVLGSYVKLLNLPIVDYMNSLPVSFAKEVVERRLEGCSTNVLKKIYNLTDMEYNDCILNVFDKRPKLEEEIIYGYYLQFDLTTSDLRNIFPEEPEKTWILLEMLQVVRPYDKYPLEAILQDDMLEEDERTKIIEIIEKRESGYSVA